MEVIEEKSERRMSRPCEKDCLGHTNSLPCSPQGISQLVDELERRRNQLSSTCVSSTEQVLQRTELSNAFLEQHNAVRETAQFLSCVVIQLCTT